MVRINDNAVAFALARDLLLEGKKVRMSVRGQSMLPFFRSGSTIILRPLRDDDLRRGHVVLGQTDTGHFVIHRIIRIESDAVILLGDGNIAGTERIARDRLYGTVDCSRPHLFLARIWLWMQPVRKYPLWILRRICRK